RGPTGSDPGAAGLFLESNPEISCDFPARRKWKAYSFHASTWAHPHRLCDHRGAIVSFEKTNRAEPGKSLGDGVGTVHRRRHHVVGGRVVSQSTHIANGGNVVAAGSVDRFHPDCIGCFP